MKKKTVIFMNFWPNGAMRHYSDSVTPLIKKNFELYYFNNYPSEMGNENNFYFSNNPFNLKNYLILFRMIKEIKKIEPIAIHINGSSCIPFLMGYPFFKKFNLIFTLHDARSHEGEKFYKKMFQRIHYSIVSRYVKKIIVHSESIKSELPKLFNKNEITIIGIPPFSHLANFKKNYKKNKKFTLLFFGRILKYKGLKYLVEAFDKLPSSNYQLIIAGEGKINEKIPQNKDIQIINKFVSDDELKNIFSISDAVVLPYTSASQSGVAYTAFAFNKPVICTNVGGLPDAIKNDINGIIVNAKSAREIKLAIEKLNNKKFYDSLVNNITKQNKLQESILSNKLKRVYLERIQ